jgi:uncharacterized protein YndB with AHSA1/START domain
MLNDLTFETTIPAAPEDVYYAFSTAQGWRDWLCNSARFETREGGTYQLSWNGGWFAAGRVKKLDRPAQIQLTWRGADDPAATEVSVALVAEGDQTKVTLTQSGFGTGKEWETSHAEAEKGWKLGFENLDSTFTIGEDLRITRRPMLGIMLGDFNTRIAQEMGSPAKGGVRVGRPIEGMGAEAAGIQDDDIIVEMANHAVAGGQDLTVALQGQRAGDTVPVTLYRGKDKITLDMELSRRPIPEFPLDPVAIAKLAKPNYEEISKEVHAVFDGVTEDEASFSPGDGEWSAKEILAHLIDGERNNTAWFTELMFDGEREYSDQGENVNERLRAMVEVIPTVEGLLNEFDVCHEETLAMLTRMEKLRRRKGPLWRVGSLLLDFPGTHERGHMDQMKAAIEAARASN